MKRTNFFLSLLIIFFLTLFFCNPAKYSISILNGANIWLKSVFPVLFPFFFLSKLLTELKFFSLFQKSLKKVSTVFFNAPTQSATIFVISIFSGSPVSAKLSQEFFENGQLSEVQCKKTSIFSSTTSPLFLVGTVGTLFFNSPKLGVFLLLSNLGSAILLGVLTKGLFVDNTTHAVLLDSRSKKNFLNEAIVSSIIGVLAVGGFICIFSMLNDMVFSIQFFNNLSPVTKAFLSGILEITNGTKQLSQISTDLNVSAIVCSAIVSFGGLCIALQSFCFLQSCGVKFRFLVLMKFCQASIASFIAFVLVCFFPF